MAANMYRVGDCVFFETSSTAPYQIRRIEELNKTPGGNVEAKVVCFYRRQDIATSLLSLADKHQDGTVRMTSHAEESVGSVRSGDISCNNADNTARHQAHLSSSDPADTGPPASSPPPSSSSSQAVDWQRLRVQLQQRELFLSRQLETLPATHIRGKCSVTLLNETETPADYVNRECCFFYSLVYDPQQRTLLADKGEIRVGSRYQAEVPSSTTVSSHEAAVSPASSPQHVEPLETVVWRPDHQLSDTAIDQYIVVARSVGTFARALDCSSSVKQPSLHMSAAAASRDVTLFHAMDVLHRSEYDVTRAVACLVPSRGPVLCRDEMEEWSASEASLFEEALEKYGKDFNDIRHDFLPWKSHRQLVEYYYMWKTTDRYVQQKRVKAVQAETRLKQVYIPSYNKPPSHTASSVAVNHMLNGTQQRLMNGGSAGSATTGSHHACAGCAETHSAQWYSWGPAELTQRLCHHCWDYWKKYADVQRLSTHHSTDGRGVTATSTDTVGNAEQQHRCPAAGCSLVFRQRALLIRHATAAHGLLLPGTGSRRPVTRTRPSFSVVPTSGALATRLAASRGAGTVVLKRVARRPTIAVDMTAARAAYEQLRVEHGDAALNKLLQLRHKKQRQLSRRCISAANRRSQQDNGRTATDEGSGDDGRLSLVSRRLHDGQLARPDWMPTEPPTAPQAARLAFPAPPRAPDGSIVYTRVENLSAALSSSCVTVSVGSNSRKRPHELVDAADAPGSGGKRQCDVMPAGHSLSDGVAQQTTVVSRQQQQMNGGRSKMSSVTRLYGGRQKVISLADAPDDVFHVANSQARMMRRHLTASQLRCAARRPCSALPATVTAAVLAAFSRPAV